MDIDWDKAPEGFDYALSTASDWKGAPEYKGTVRFAKKRENSTYFECDQGLYPHVGRGSWVVVATRPEKWNGEGIPPVGTVCEVKSTAWGKERDWFKAQVKYLSPFTVVLDDFPIGELEGEFVVHPNTVQFRPIKTKEQLVAEEREKEVDQMVQRIAENTTGIGIGAAMICAKALHAAGYRKQEDN